MDKDLLEKMIKNNPDEYLENLGKRINKAKSIEGIDEIFKEIYYIEHGEYGLTDRANELKSQWGSKKYELVEHENSKKLGEKLLKEELKNPDEYFEKVENKINKAKSIKEINEIYIYNKIYKIKQGKDGLPKDIIDRGNELYELWASKLNELEEHEKSKKLEQQQQPNEKNEQETIFKYDIEPSNETFEASKVEPEEEIEEDFDWEAAFDREDDEIEQEPYREDYEEEIEENPEQQQLEEERNNRREQQKNRKLIELLREQADVQSKITKASWAKSGREAKENINKAVKKLSDYLNKQAEIYGANKETIDKIVDDYKERLEANENEKNAQIKELEEEKGYWENREQRAIGAVNYWKNKKKGYEKSIEYKQFKDECKKIESEITKAIKDGEFDKADESLKKLKNKNKNSEISRYDKSIEECNEEMKKAREGIKEKKDKIKKAREELKDKNKNNKVNDIVNEKLKEENKELAKQNTFQKFIGSIAYSFKKIGGKRKFEEKVVQPIKEAISTVGSGIKSVPSKIGNVCDDIKDKKEAVINKIKESIIDNIEEKTEKLEQLQATNERE